MMMKFRFFLVAALLFAVSAIPAQVQAGAIRGGIGITNTLTRNDDGSTGIVSMGFSANFFGTTYSGLYVNNNGNLTFDSPLSTFTPFNLGTTSRVIIAPYFADVDTRGPGNPVTYGTGTVDGHDAFAANYVDVAHYSVQPNLNSFQVVLIDRSDISAGDFDIEFNYDSIIWETGEASGGDSSGLGGNSARVGYSNGTTETFELTGSAINGAFLDSGPASTSLINNSLNSNVLGRYVFNVRNGVVQPPVVPEPSSCAIFGLGALVAIGRRRRRR